MLLPIITVMATIFQKQSHCTLSSSTAETPHSPASLNDPTTQRIPLNRQPNNTTDFYIKETERYCIGGGNYAIQVGMSHIISEGSSPSQEQYQAKSFFRQTPSEYSQETQPISSLLQHHGILEAFDSFETLRSHLMDILQAHEPIQQLLSSKYDTLKLVESLKSSMRVFGERERDVSNSLDGQNAILKETLLNLTQQRLENHCLRERLKKLNLRLQAERSPINTPKTQGGESSAISNSSNPSNFQQYARSSSKLPFCVIGRQGEIEPFTLVAQTGTGKTAQSTVESSRVTDQKCVAQAASLGGWEWGEVAIRAVRLQKKLFQAQMQATNVAVMGDEEALSLLEGVAGWYGRCGQCEDNQVGEERFKREAVRFMHLVEQASGAARDLITPYYLGTNGPIYPC